MFRLSELFSPLIPSRLRSVRESQAQKFFDHNPDHHGQSTKATKIYAPTPNINHKQSKLAVSMVLVAWEVAGRMLEELATPEEATVPDADTGELDRTEPPVTVFSTTESRSYR